VGVEPTTYALRELFVQRWQPLTSADVVCGVGNSCVGSVGERGPPLVLVLPICCPGQDQDHAAQPRAATRRRALTAHLTQTGARPVLTLCGLVIVVVLVLVAVSAWWLTRDTKRPARPGRHRPKRRDPHDPIRGDDEVPRDQPWTGAKSERPAGWDSAGRLRSRLANEDGFVSLRSTQLTDTTVGGWAHIIRSVTRPRACDVGRAT